MKQKNKNTKFFRNVLIGTVSLILVAFIVNIAPGYRRDKYKDITNLVINDEDVTEQLKNLVYIDENGIIYLSQEDIHNLFDQTIFYDEENSQIITTSNTKVASLKLEETTMTVNEANVKILNSIIIKDNIVYIPISEMAIVYNIELDYIKKSNIVIIDKLNTGMIKADIAENTNIRFKPRGLSKKIGDINVGEKVSCFYTTSRGWRLIRTKDGILGYVKANVLANEYIIRQDMQDTRQTKVIDLKLEDNYMNIIKENNEDIKILIKEFLNIDNNGKIETTEEGDENTKYKVWSTISNKGIEVKSQEMIKNYSTRTMLIDSIAKVAVQYNINGINIDFHNISDTEVLKRFIIEMAPRLQEIGISMNIILNDGQQEKDFIGIVNYIIKESK